MIEKYAFSAPGGKARIHYQKNYKLVYFKKVIFDSTINYFSY